MRFPEFGRVRILWRGGRTLATSVEKSRKKGLNYCSFSVVLLGGYIGRLASFNSFILTVHGLASHYLTVSYHTVSYLILKCINLSYLIYHISHII